MAFQALSNRTFGVGLKKKVNDNSNESSLKKNFSNTEKSLFKFIVLFLNPIKMIKKQNREKLNEFTKTL